VGGIESASCLKFFESEASAFSSVPTEGAPREPVHIHVEKVGKEAKFWLIPDIKLAYNDGYDARTLRELMRIVEANRDRIERAWDEYFG
jgi:hypothetical protein